MQYFHAFIVNSMFLLPLLLMFADSTVFASDHSAPLWSYEQDQFALQCTLEAGTGNGEAKLFTVRLHDRKRSQHWLLFQASRSSASGTGRLLDDYRPIYLNLTDTRVEFVTNWDGVRAFVFTRGDVRDEFQRSPQGPLGTVSRWNGGAVWAKMWLDSDGRTGLELVNERNEYGLFYLSEGERWKRRD